MNSFNREDLVGDVYDANCYLPSVIMSIIPREGESKIAGHSVLLT